MFDLLKLPFKSVRVLFLLVFVVGILEFLGLLFYGAFTSEAATEAMMNGPTPGKFLAFVLASPDRIVVAAALGLFGTVLVLAPSAPD